MEIGLRRRIGLQRHLRKSTQQNEKVGEIGLMRFGREEGEDSGGGRDAFGI